MTFTIKSSAFDHGGAIPTVYTCEGKDISPPLSWWGMPDTARSLVLIIEDPDAPDPNAPEMTWIHWILINIPPDAHSLSEGVTPEELPPGTIAGLNDWKRVGYGGPCPPTGRHRYFHKLFALDTVLEGMISPSMAQVENAIKGHIISQAEVMGTYQKR
jgi:Raf kinase inhibitor-like YbhB/YbcL family protein